MFRFVRFTIFLLALTWTVAATSLQAKPTGDDSGDAESSTSALENWSTTKPGKFIMDLARDPARGGIWIATEDHGVWFYKLPLPLGEGRGEGSQAGPEERGTSDEGPDSDAQWTHYTTKEGLGDDHIYALAVDHQDRVWVGHLNHGVSVFNGQTWENYDVTDGPLGERVFDITVCPVDGSVWIATDLGLTRYSRQSDAWAYYTRSTTSNGLPSDQIEAIAFDKHGTIYAATQCDGLAICSPSSLGRGAKDEGTSNSRRLAYRRWRTITSRFTNEPPEQPVGSGLPSNLINDVMVGEHDKIWVATDEGLAWSDNHGHSFRFIRGKDWFAKIKDSYKPPSSSQLTLLKARWSRRKLPLLSEDHVTCLAQDAEGHIWVGHWQTGFDALAPTTGEIFTLDKPPPQDKNYVTTILPMAGQSPEIACYGGGIGQLSDKFETKSDSRSHFRGRERAGVRATPSLSEAKGRVSSAHSTSAIPHFPSPAPPPTLKQLQTGLKHIKSLNSKLPRLWAAYLGDDWTTQGDWFGRYGRQNAILCAMGSPLNHDVGRGGGKFWADGEIGPHHRKDDVLRLWVAWLKTNQQRCLYDPKIGHRRQASWDDHAEAYPMTWEGPNLWITITVPKGVHLVSLYFVNKDGHARKNRFRDYVVKVYPYSTDFDRLRRLPPLTQTRIHDFWYGKYANFIVRGPVDHTVRYLMEIDKNDSFNTIISAVMFQRLQGPLFDFDDAPLIWTGALDYDPPAMPDLTNASQRLKAAVELWNALDQAWNKRGAVNLERPVRLMCYRAALTEHAPAPLLARWRWKLHLWTSKDREAFDQSMKKFWQKEIRENPQLATAHM